MCSLWMPEAITVECRIFSSNCRPTWKANSVMVTLNVTYGSSKPWPSDRPPPLLPIKNSPDLHQSQERPLAKVGWTCPPQSTPWWRPCNRQRCLLSSVASIQFFEWWGRRTTERGAKNAEGSLWVECALPSLGVWKYAPIFLKFYKQTATFWCILESYRAAVSGYNFGGVKRYSHPTIFY